LIRTRVPSFLLMLVMSAFASGQASSSGGNNDSFFEDRLKTSSQADKEQPHWIAPLFTTTPRLLEQLRFDAVRQTTKGFDTVNYGGGKGLELIPTHNTEIVISTPPYLTHEQPGVQDGVGDMSFLLKYRIAARNEEAGNYIVTAFLGATVPTGTYKNGASSAVVTPTLAFGKGWGRFDFQSTFAIGIPTENMDKLGTPLAHNVAFQYHIRKYFWPEFEVNSTFWPNGAQSGNKQVFLSPGLIVGKFHLWKRLGVTLGSGVQLPVTDFRTTDRVWLSSVRFPF
jgi:hypothetical protein